MYGRKALGGVLKGQHWSKAAIELPSILEAIRHV